METRNYLIVQLVHDGVHNGVLILLRNTKANLVLEVEASHLTYTTTSKRQRSRAASVSHVLQAVCTSEPVVLPCQLIRVPIGHCLTGVVLVGPHVILVLYSLDVVAHGIFLSSPQKRLGHLVLSAFDGLVATSKP